ncbi:serum amyloid P-component-like [Scomber japonicus]|uniref:serum amyloid P-component-like n=1 Tax=Scomber japonicus TaxID=13676 RepID=UPI00230555D7|nr:serum amyloid P-component-like [Scomber japonicus]
MILSASHWAIGTVPKHIRLTSVIALYPCPALPSTYKGRSNKLRLSRSSEVDKDKDLSGKLFVFPRLGGSDYVKLATTKTTLNSATVCFRFITDITQGYSLFSLATPVHKNAFLLFKPREDVIRVHVNDLSTDFLSLPSPPNTWHSMCTTWNSDDGLSQLMVNGNLTIKRFVASKKPITGVPIIILGQDQDSYGGGFDAKQSFIGMISKVHMWDYVLSPTELRAYEKGENFSPGNMLNWRALDFQPSGLASVHEDPEHVVRCT